MHGSLAWYQIFPCSFFFHIFNVQVEQLSRAATSGMFSMAKSHATARSIQDLSAERRAPLPRRRRTPRHKPPAWCQKNKAWQGARAQETNMIHVFCCSRSTKILLYFMLAEFCEILSAYISWGSIIGAWLHVWVPTVPSERPCNTSCQLGNGKEKNMEE